MLPGPTLPWFGASQFHRCESRLLTLHTPFPLTLSLCFRNSGTAVLCKHARTQRKLCRQFVLPFFAFHLFLLFPPWPPLSLLLVTYTFSVLPLVYSTFPFFFCFSLGVSSGGLLQPWVRLHYPAFPPALHHCLNITTC